MKKKKKKIDGREENVDGKCQRAKMSERKFFSLFLYLFIYDYD